MWSSIMSIKISKNLLQVINPCTEPRLLQNNFVAKNKGGKLPPNSQFQLIVRYKYIMQGSTKTQLIQKIKQWNRQNPTSTLKKLGKYPIPAKIPINNQIDAPPYNYNIQPFDKQSIPVPSHPSHRRICAEIMQRTVRRTLLQEQKKLSQNLMVPAQNIKPKPSYSLGVEDNSMDSVDESIEFIVNRQAFNSEQHHRNYFLIQMLRGLKVSISALVTHIHFYWMKNNSFLNKAAFLLASHIDIQNAVWAIRESKFLQFQLIIFAENAQSNVSIVEDSQDEEDIQKREKFLLEARAFGIKVVKYQKLLEVADYIKGLSSNKQITKMSDLNLEKRQLNERYLNYFFINLHFSVLMHLTKNNHVIHQQLHKIRRSMPDFFIFYKSLKNSEAYNDKVRYICSFLKQNARQFVEISKKVVEFLFLKDYAELDRHAASKKEYKQLQLKARDKRQPSPPPSQTKVEDIRRYYYEQGEKWEENKKIAQMQNKDKREKQTKANNQMSQKSSQETKQRQAQKQLKRQWKSEFFQRFPIKSKKGDQFSSSKNENLSTFTKEQKELQEQDQK